MRFLIVLIFGLLIASLLPSSFAEEEVVLIDVQKPESFTTGVSPYLHYPLGFLNRGVVLNVKLHASVAHTSLLLAERHLTIWAETRDHNLAIYPFRSNGTEPYEFTFPRPIPADDRYVFVVFTGGGANPQVLRLTITASGLRPLSELSPSVVAQVVENLTQVQTNIVNLQQDITRMENMILEQTSALTRVEGDLVNIGISQTTINFLLVVEIALTVSITIAFAFYLIHKRGK